MAQTPLALVTAAARALIRGGQWDLADQLLAGTAARTPAERTALALERARVAVEVRQWRGAGDPAGALAAAAEAAGACADASTACDLDLLRLFAAYWAELEPADGSPPRFGPEGRDPRVLDDLRDRAARLTASAPDGRRAAHASFYAGLIADNLCGDAASADELFSKALAGSAPRRDDDIACEALRHLGGHSMDDGDLALTRERWERSAELAARAGWAPLALAQQALLAELALAGGDRAGAAALAGEVRRWAGALGLSRLEAQAARVVSDAG